MGERRSQMRQKMFVVAGVMVMAVLFVVSGNAFAGREAGSCVIAGYIPGQFSISGEPEKKTEDCITKMRALQLDPSEELLLITVMGSADASGTLFANDNLALARAEQISAKIAAHFPNAVVKHWSVGDSENLRQVTVAFSVENASVVQEDSRYVAFAKKALLVGTIVLTIILFAYTVWHFCTKLEAPMPTIRKGTEKERIIPINIDGYIVSVAHCDGYYWSPFHSKNGNQISRKTMGEIKYSLKGCLSKSEFAEEKELLIGNGIIRKEVEQELLKKEGGVS